jgi:predicted component of type VI protein secretion system
MKDELSCQKMLKDNELLVAYLRDLNKAEEEHRKSLQRGEIRSVINGNIKSLIDTRGYINEHNT